MPWALRGSRPGPWRKPPTGVVAFWVRVDWTCYGAYVGAHDASLIAALGASQALIYSIDECFVDLSARSRAICWHGGTRSSNRIGRCVGTVLAASAWGRPKSWQQTGQSHRQDRRAHTGPLPGHTGAGLQPGQFPPARRRLMPYWHANCGAGGTGASGAKWCRSSRRPVSAEFRARLGALRPGAGPQPLVRGAGAHLPGVERARRAWSWRTWRRPGTPSRTPAPSAIPWSSRTT